MALLLRLVRGFGAVAVRLQHGSGGAVPAFAARRGAASELPHLDAASRHYGSLALGTRSAWLLVASSRLRGASALGGPQAAPLSSGVSGADSVALGSGAVLVKFGDGQDTDIDIPTKDLWAMRRGRFLDALAASSSFGASFSGVPHDKCRVFVLRKVAGDEPTAAEEADALELRGAKSLGELLALADPSSSAYFVRVRVEAPPPPPPPPPTHAIGSLPHDPQLGIPAAVWATMGPRAQEAAVRAGEQRRRVRSVAALRVLGDHLRRAAPNAPLAPLSAADAQAGGISVLSAGGDGGFEAGLFDVPPLGDAVAVAPKSFSFAQGLRVLALPQRLQFAFEFVRAVMDREHDAGTLFSGPNGVGKSGIGLLAYLLSVHLGQLVAYIPRAQDWVKEAEHGNGTVFLLETFWRQNADIIAASDALRPAFQAVMEDRAEPFTEAAMKVFRQAVALRAAPGAGIIVDEVQTITQAVAAVNVPNPSIPVQLAGRFFASRWHDWNNEQGVFTRLSIASSHGARELKLPDSEERRLRFVLPLPPALIAVLQADKSSPAYVADEKLRSHVAFIAGGVLRRLIGGADLARGKRNSKDVREQILHALRTPMDENCAHWLAALPAGGADRAAAIDSALDLVRGELPWSRAKPLYDDGLVARTESSSLVAPVSPIAAAVILQTTAAEVRGQRVRLRSKRAGAERGYELERQLRAAVNRCNATVPAKRLDGTVTSSLQLRASYALVFKELHEVVPRDDPVAYMPHNPNFACDAILMPAADDAASPIILLEPSATDPRDADRVKKVLKWFGPEGVVTALRAAYPQRQVVSALVWDQVLDSRPLSKSAAALARAGSGRAAGAGAGAAGATDAVVVIDLDGIVRLYIVP